MNKIFYCKERVISEYPVPVGIPLTRFATTKPLPLIIDQILPTQSVIVSIDKYKITNIALIDKNNDIFPIYGLYPEIIYDSHYIDYRKHSLPYIEEAHRLCSYLFNNLSLSDLLYYYDELQNVEFKLKEFFMMKQIGNQGQLIQYTKTNIKNEELFIKISELLKLYPS